MPMDFVTSHFGKMNLWPVEHFFQHIIVTYANNDQYTKLSKLRQDIQENSCGFKNRNLLHFHIAEPNEDYKILLIGKDGGVKFEGENRTLQQIFNQIDTMPMRRNEMQFDSC